MISRSNGHLFFLKLITLNHGSIVIINRKIKKTKTQSISKSHSHKHTHRSPSPHRADLSMSVFGNIFTHPQKRCLSCFWVWFRTRKKGGACSDLSAMLSPFKIKNKGNGAVCPHLINHVSNEVDVTSLDWCGYVLAFLRTSRLNWKPNDYEKYYNGPATLLTLLYLDRTKFNKLDVERQRPVFKNWNGFLELRENLEADLGSFGVLPLRPGFVPLQIEDYDDFSRRLVDVSKQKKMFFKFLIDKDDKKDEFYYQKMREVFSMHPKFYDGEKPEKDRQENAEEQNKNDDNIDQSMALVTFNNDQMKSKVVSKTYSRVSKNKEEVAAVNTTVLQKRGRGRPRKNKDNESVSDVHGDDDDAVAAGNT